MSFSFDLISGSSSAIVLNWWGGSCCTKCASIWRPGVLAPSCYNGTLLYIEPFLKPPERHAALRERRSRSPEGGPGVSPPRKFLKYHCNLVQSGAFLNNISAVYSTQIKITVFPHLYDQWGGPPRYFLLPPHSHFGLIAASLFHPPKKKKKYNPVPIIFVNSNAVLQKDITIPFETISWPYHCWHPSQPLGTY